MAKRSTTDVLILMIAGTICLMVLGAGVALMVIEVVHPEEDTSRAAGILGAVLNTLVGMLAGYLAGRTRRSQDE